MWFILTIAAVVLAFFCARRYSDWISSRAIELQAAQILRLESEMRSLYAERALMRSSTIAHVLKAYSAGKAISHPKTAKESGRVSV